MLTPNEVARPVVLRELVRRLGVNYQDPVVHAACLLMERIGGLDLGYRYGLKAQAVWSPDLAVDLDDLAEERRLPRFLLPTAVLNRIDDTLSDHLITDAEFQLQAAVVLLVPELDYAGAIEHLSEYWPADDVRATSWWCVFHLPDGKWRRPLGFDQTASLPVLGDANTRSISILRHQLEQLVALGECLGVTVDVSLTPIAGWSDKPEVEIEPVVAESPMFTAPSHDYGDVRTLRAVG